MRYRLPSHDYKVDGRPVLFVDSGEKIERVKRMIEDSRRLAVDVEAYGFKPASEHPYKRGRMASLQFTCDGPKLKNVHDSRFIFIPNWGKYKGIYRNFKRELQDSNKKKVLHNNKFDFHVLANEGIDVKGLHSDTMMKAYLGNTAAKLALKDQINRHFDADYPDFGDVFRVPKLKANGEPGKQTVIPDLLDVVDGKYNYALKNGRKRLVEYAVKDTHFTIMLDDFWDKRLAKIEWYGKKSMLDYYHQFDLPYSEVLFKMERRGIKLDLDRLEVLQKEITQYRDQCERKFFKGVVKLGVSPSSIEGYRLSGKGSKTNLEDLFINLLGVDLPRTNPTKKFPNGQPSTADKALSTIRSRKLRPIIELLVEYRSVQDKLLNTYVNPFLEIGQTDFLDGRMRTVFKQNGAVTGRLSSATPNLQNVPRVGEDEADQFGIRGAFIADDNDHEIGDGDLSQIEMRMMAHVTKDKVLIEALRNGWDLHARTAIACFPEVAKFCEGKKLDKKLLDAVKKNFPGQRQGAKTLNFMIAYGGGPMRYADIMGTSMHEGKRAINAFFNTYTGLQRGINQVRSFARQYGYVRTILNRRIHVPDINSNNQALRGMAERQAFNYRVQGSAGEWIKMAMLLIDRCPKLKKLDVYMMLQIHDELVTGSPKKARKEAKPLLEAYLSTPHKFMDMQGLVVETPADFGFGPNWLEAKAA